MKRIIFVILLLLLLILSTVFTQTDWVEKNYSGIFWQQPGDWEETEEMEVPGKAWAHGDISDDMEIQDGIIFVVMNDSAVIQNMLEEMKADKNTVIRVSGEDSINGIKREFYSGTIDQDDQFMTFQISYFPNEASEKEFLMMAMIKGTKTGDYLGMVDRLIKTVKQTETSSKKTSPIKEPRQIIVTRTIITTDKVEYEPGERITITYQNAPAKSTVEWVGLYAAGSENSQYLTWEYLDGKTNGTFSFEAPEKEGDYFLKLFGTDAMYQEIAISTVFVVKKAEVVEENYQLSFKLAEKSQYLPGEAIEITYEIPEGIISKYPWIGIIPSEISHGKESENDKYDLAYQYLRNRTGTLIFKAPVKEGSYDFRLNDSDSNGLEKASITFEVKKEQPASLSLSQKAYETDTTITVTFNNAPAESNNDWIAMYKDGAENMQYIRWVYLQGEKEGSVEFKAPSEPGEYRFRMFSNNSYNKLAESEVISVKKPDSPSVAESLFVNEYAICSRIFNNKPDDERVRFTFNDKTIYMWVQLDQYSKAHEAKWEWIQPNGDVYSAATLQIKSAAEQGYLSLSNYAIMSWLETTAINRNLSGIWKVQFYLDDQLLITRQFILQ